MPLVVDTDVISFLYKRDSRARLYEPHLNDPPFIVSFMSLAELRRWTLETQLGWNDVFLREDSFAICTTEETGIAHNRDCNLFEKPVANDRVRAKPTGKVTRFVRECGFGTRKVVPPARFQRATFRLGGGRSMQLSYGSKRRVNSKW